MRLPIRSVVCWTGGEKGKQKNPEIPNPVEKDKATLKQSKKSKRDGNRHARSRTQTPGGIVELKKKTVILVLVL